MIKLLSLFAALFLFGNHSAAQNIILSELSTQSQLPSGEIYCNFQDSEGYMWYGTEEGLCRDDGYAIKTFRSDFHTPELIRSNIITCITEDKKKRIWFGTKRGVYILDKTQYHIFPLADDEIKEWSIANIISTSDSTIWISGNNSILRYDMHQKRIGTYEEWEGNPKKIEYFYEDTDLNTLWIIQWNGRIFHFDNKTNQFISHPWPFREFPTSIIKDRYSSAYWVTTWGKGVVRFDPFAKETEKMFALQPTTISTENYFQGETFRILQDSILNYLWVISTDNLYAYNISQDNTLSPVDTSSFLSTEKKILSSIISDRLGNLWISGYSPHSFTISFQENHIEHDRVSVLKRMLKYPVSICILVHDNGSFWFWPKRGGLCLYNPQNNHIEFSKLGKRKLSPFLEKSNLNNGIFCVLKDKIVLLLQHKEDKIYESEIVDITPNTEPGERIRTLHEDISGYLWIGTSNNLFRYNQKTKELHKIWENTGFINDITSFNNQNIYLATETNGLLCLSKNNKKTTCKVNENCSHITISPDQKVWIGTQQGNIYCYSPQTNELISKAEECGLEGSAIIDIEASHSGKIWMMTTQKIIIYDPDKNTFHTIHSSDPTIFMNKFNCLYKEKSGIFYIGGTEGFLTYPSLLSQENTIKTSKESSLTLTAMKVNGHLRVFNYKNEVIKLKPNERNIELFLSTFNPLNAEKIHYAFKYKNEGSNWNYLLQGQNNIYLPQIPKGYNEIEVKATDKDGYWTNNSMTIRLYLSPQWYETWFAYTIYILIVLTATLYLIHIYIKRQKDKNRILMEERIAQMKYRFFTNISHELRTPLTLIITPLDTIIKKVSDKDVKKQLGIIYKNAQGLLELVNQLLDFRRIEMKGETLVLSRGELKSILALIHENFQPIAIQKKIAFNYDCEPDSIYMNIDYLKIQKIVNNLLSNAFKFTEEGEITLSLKAEIVDNRQYAVIKVEDTGIGIPEKELNSIFERFHQVNSKKENAGSGIGLHLVKEYTEMHQGYITVESTVNIGSIFHIYIPTDLVVSKEAEMMENEEEDVEKKDINVHDKKILIVEDNPEFRAYLKNELSHYFTVYEASDGEEGEKEALEKKPNIVITDLMMPKVNGLELCRRIKNNLEISHIPIILLTASNNIENEKTGYKEGADAYISKPFNWDILLARIQNLIKQNVQRQQAFKIDIEATPKSVTISALDEELLGKAINLIEANINNSEYSIEDLSSDMAMSRVNLFRKIRSITGMSPSEFVKSARLKRAAKLLSEGELNVVEVAYSVGFNTPSYFTKSFKKMFGVLPTEYNTRLKER